MSDSAWFANGSNCCTASVIPIAGLNHAIKEMIAYDGPVILDCVVEKHENCFPMIPSGKAHNEMILCDEETADAIDNVGKTRV